MKEEITYPLRIRRDLWERFKALVPRTKTLNEALVELIEREVERRGET